MVRLSVCLSGVKQALQEGLPINLCITKVGPLGGPSVCMPLRLSGVKQALQEGLPIILCITKVGLLGGMSVCMCVGFSLSAGRAAGSPVCLSLRFRAPPHPLKRQCGMGQLPACLSPSVCLSV